MIKHKIIKTNNGRITIQTNSFNIPEIKIRADNQTLKLQCPYESIENIEIIVNELLNFYRHEVRENMCGHCYEPIRNCICFSEL